MVSKLFVKLKVLYNNHRLLLFLIIFIAVIGFVGYKIYQTQNSENTELSRGATATTTKLPPSKEVLDHEFWEIVQQLKPQPGETISTGSNTKKVSKLSNVLKYGAKGSGILSAATILAFPDDAGAPFREITKFGATSYEYQDPAPNSPQYSSRHSFNEDYHQYYVRVHVATGSRSEPKITHALPFPARIKFSSKQRGDDDGCGKNGPFGHRWKDSTQNFNSKGWVYIPNCRKDNTFEVSFDYLPKELKDASIARTVTTAGNNELTVNLDYYIDATSGDREDFDIIFKPKPGPEPERGPKTEVESCNEILEETVAKASVKADHRSFGGAVTSFFNAQGTQQAIITGIIGNIQDLKNLREKATAISKQCEDQFDRLWTIKVVMGDVDRRGENYRLIHPVRVTMLSTGSRSGACKTGNDESSDSTIQTATFWKCKPGPFTIALGGVGAYKVLRTGNIPFVAVSTTDLDFNGWRLATPSKPGELPPVSGRAMRMFQVTIHMEREIASDPHKDNSRGKFNSLLPVGGSNNNKSKKPKTPRFKRYTNGDVKYFARAARTFWGEANQKDIPGMVTCTPEKVRVKYTSFTKRYRYARPPSSAGESPLHINYFIRVPMARNIDPRPLSKCSITINTDTYARAFTNNDKARACVLFIKGYGQLIGKPLGNNSKFFMWEGLATSHIDKLAGIGLSRGGNGMKCDQISGPFGPFNNPIDALRGRR